jgi:hypothetical protein
MSIIEKILSMRMRLTLTLLVLLLSPTLAQVMPSSALDGVTIVTGFAHDRGDMLEYVEYKGKKYEPDQAANAIIPKLGWEDQSKREDIAWAWVVNVCTVGSTVLREKPKEFEQSKTEFETPKVHLFEDGSVEVVLWYREPVGMVPGHHYSKRSYGFSPEGKLTVTALEDVRIP